MFAVITESTDTDINKKVELERVGELWHFKVGKKLSRRRLKRALREFEGNYIFSKTVNTRGLVPFSTDRLKSSVLFQQFCDHVLHLNGMGLTVGIVDRDGYILKSDTMTKLIAHAESVIVCTLSQNIEELCRRWLLLTGTCPEATADPKYLLNCDCVYSPELRVATTGVLFGKGGLSIDRNKIELPEAYYPLVESGVDPIDLACINLFLTKKHQEQTCS